MGQGRKETSLEKKRVVSGVQKVLDELSKDCSCDVEKGRRLEKFVKKYFETDPVYKNEIENVWLWDEWPHRWGKDIGIDLVVESRAGEYWAIQCKFFSPDRPVSKKDIDSFISASSKRFTINEEEIRFSYRYIVETSYLGANALKVIENQDPPVKRIGCEHLDKSNIDWDKFSWSEPTKLHRKNRNSLRNHQEEALRAVSQGFKRNERGKLIMACGTGKTFTSLKIAEKLVPKGGKILFLAPSISLVGQTLREWLAESAKNLHSIVVCSDTKVGKEDEGLRTHDLAYPATTDANKILKYSKAKKKNDDLTVVFSTYQSIDAVSEAQNKGMGEFDLIICDEAHRTTGVTVRDEQDSHFTKVHDNSFVKSRKRLFMTATPRIFAEGSKTRASLESAKLYSMDDEEYFGPEFYNLNFGDAVDRGLLADYRVLIVTVDSDQMAPLVNDYNEGFRISDKKAINLDFATKLIGSWSGFSKRNATTIDEKGEEKELDDDIEPMRRVVAFSNTINGSKEVKDNFEGVVTHFHSKKTPELQCEIEHVDGTYNAARKHELLEWLRDEPEAGTCKVLSNARCLSEGVDVPALDGVVFFDTKDSIVEIAQSVGRVMRKSEGKKYGYIVLPIAIPRSKVSDFNGYIEKDNQFKGIWKVLRSLRAHDERLVDEVEFKRKIAIVDGSGRSRKVSSKKRKESGSSFAQLPLLPVGEISQAVYATIPKKLGDREYWRDWAKEVADIAQRLIKRIEALSKKKETKKAFDNFLKGLRQNLHSEVTKQEAIEMLAQHEITRPIFEAMFIDQSFVLKNPVSQSMDKVIAEMDKHGLSAETKEMEPFYEHIKKRASHAKSDKSRQDLIRNLYDSFFQSAFPKLADRLGIVYTPIQIVDFILKSTDSALKEHFKTGISNKDVQVLDPFVGTGTFIARLLQSDLIQGKDLSRKFQNELWANEIVLLAYYIASINIESAYRDRLGKEMEYQSFPGMVLTDTFDMDKEDDPVEKIFPTNRERRIKQKKQDIRVIVGNPPYSSGQQSSNDNNPNQSYPNLDKKIKETYVANADSQNVNSLYDSYIRSLRWASDRVGDKGIVGFVTNGSFIDGNVAAGVRKSLYQEFSAIYCLNLRGDQRTSGERSRQEGGKIFGSGSRVPVAITLLVKDPAHKGECKLFYHDIGDYLKREEKLSLIQKFHDEGGLKGVPWKKVKPDDKGDWVNQRDSSYDDFILLGDKSGDNPEAIFNMHSNGMKTQRDAWMYNFSKESLLLKIKGMVDTYNSEMRKFDKSTDNNVDNVIDFDPKKISWDADLKRSLERGITRCFDRKLIREGSYRPFSKRFLYADPFFMGRGYQIFGKKCQFFPTPKHSNQVVCVPGGGVKVSFSSYIVNSIPDVQLMSNAQCFPLYWYEPVENKNGTVYKKHETITDWALKKFRKQYGNSKITKEDIFYYVYGVLHSEEFCERFSHNLRKESPRIPFVENFQSFKKAGKKLAEMHLDYEEGKEFDLKEIWREGAPKARKEAYRVEKMKFAKEGKKHDKSKIIYNKFLTVEGIPEEAYEYQLNGRSAIEWIIDQYQVKVDKKTGIVNDPNDFSTDPTYILSLLKKIVYISCESEKIVKSLPSLGLEADESFGGNAA